MRKLKCIVADKCPVYSYGMILAIKNNADLFDFIEVDNHKELLEKFDDSVDFLILDAGLISSDQICFYNRLLDKVSIPVLVVFDYANDFSIEKSKLIGARGFFDKRLNESDFNNAVSLAFNGESAFFIFLKKKFEKAHRFITDEKLSSLTKQQKNILGCVLTGKLNKEIAFDLGLSESTVKNHISNILRKLDVSNRRDIVVCFNHRDNAYVKNKILK